MHDKIEEGVDESQTIRYTIYRRPQYFKIFKNEKYLCKVKKVVSLASLRHILESGKERRRNRKYDKPSISLLLRLLLHPSFVQRCSSSSCRVQPSVRKERLEDEDEDEDDDDDGYVRTLFPCFFVVVVVVVEDVLRTHDIEDKSRKISLLPNPL